MKPLSVLLVEDNADDAELLIHELERANYRCHWRRVDRPEPFLRAVEGEAWDLILADFSMPRFSSIAALELLKKSGRDIPFIMVSGSAGEETAVAAMRAGAQDFFPKGNLRRLAAAVERELREARVRKERLEAMAELRGVEERYRRIVENVREYAIFMLDSKGLVASWNRGAERLTGYREDEILGRPLELFYSEQERAVDKPKLTLDAVCQSGSQLAEGCRLRRDGSSFWAECTLDRIQVDGELFGFSAIFHDITEKKRLLDDLRQSVNARDEFLTIAAHELKTPLTSMELHMQSFKRLVLSDPKAAKKLEVLEHQARRLGQLVNDLLDVARITSNRIELQPERFDLREAVQAVIYRMTPWIERANSAVSVSSPEPLIGCWDRGRVETIFSNLLSNALKYGEGKPVEVAIRKEGGLGVLEVRDSGIGVPPQEHERIFQRFERAVPVRHYGGFGLGLWIVRQIVEAHQGTIRVRSHPGEGSVFTVELPLEARAFQEPRTEEGNASATTTH